MNILDKIVAKKKERLPEYGDLLRQTPQRKRKAHSFVAKDKATSNLSIIAEIKKGSPSKGLFAPELDVQKQAALYQALGATAISVLTDEHFYANMDNLVLVTKNVDIPVLAKDFFISTEQIELAYRMGADIILLIAACLSRKELKDLLCTAHSLGLETIVELHDASEVEKLEGIVPSIIGINNRNLKTFEVHLNRSIELFNQVQQFKVPIIAESGIYTRVDAEILSDAGFDGLLIGESIIRSSNPETVLKSFVSTPKRRML